MSKHRANVAPNTHPEQPVGRHRKETPARFHWYATCMDVAPHDALATEEGQVDCETCLIALRSDC